MALVLCLGAIGAIMQGNRHRGEPQIKEVFLAVREMLLGLGLDQIDCPSYYGDFYEFRACFALKNTPESIISKLDKSLAGMSMRTMGWQQDYGLWIAKYRVLQNPKLRVSIALTEKIGNFELEEHMPLKNYHTFARLTIVETED